MPTTERGEEERVAVAAAQQDSIVAVEHEAGGRADPLEGRRPVPGAGLVDEVAGVPRAVVLALRAEGDAEQGEVVLGAEDLGGVAERGGRQARAVDGEAGDERRGGRPEGDQDAPAAPPAPAAAGGGGVGAVAEVAEPVEEDRLRGRLRVVLGVDRRRDQEELPERRVLRRIVWSPAVFHGCEQERDQRKGSGCDYRPAGERTNRSDAIMGGRTRRTIIGAAAAVVGVGGVRIAIDRS